MWHYQSRIGTFHEICRFLEFSAFAGTEISHHPAPSIQYQLRGHLNRLVRRVSHLHHLRYDGGPRLQILYQL